MKFKAGDYIKVEFENRVFIAQGITAGESEFIPCGWPIDQYGSAVNPSFCEIYTGAKSAIPGN